jgi:hypothetical protein
MYGHAKNSTASPHRLGVSSVSIITVNLKLSSFLSDPAQQLNIIIRTLFLFPFLICSLILNTVHKRSRIFSKLFLNRPALRFVCYPYILEDCWRLEERFKLLIPVVPICTTYRRSLFCSCSVFMGSKWFAVKTAITSPNSINRLIFVMLHCCVFFEVRTESLHII